MKALAFCAAWLLRCVYVFDLADRIEAWAGIDYAAELESQKFSDAVLAHIE